MYTPSAFVIDDPEKIRAFIAANGFGILLSIRDGEIEETHTPMVLSGDGRELFGHIARANPQWRQWVPGAKVKALFHGPHCYVSPRYYRNGSNVPTWNYTAASVTGTISVLDGRAEQKRLMERLVAQYEGGFPEPWKLDEADGNIMRLFDAIVCFRIEVERIEAKFKLNQNKPPEDRESVVAHLKATGAAGDAEVARLMEERG